MLPVIIYITLLCDSEQFNEDKTIKVMSDQMLYNPNAIQILLLPLWSKATGSLSLDCSHSTVVTWRTRSL